MKLQISKIDPFVGELLYEHDCVIITDLGGFVASHRPAGVNPALHVLSPPSKRIAFNASLRTNDGLLASHIAARTGMTYPEACDTIRDFVNEAFRNFDSGKRLSIEKVGVLYLDNQKRLQFLPDNNSNFLIDSFGLAPVHTPVVRRENEKPERKEAVVRPFKAPVPREGRGIGVLEMIPAAAVLAIMFITPPALERFNTQLSGMLPFSRMIEVIHDLKGEETRPHTVSAPILPNPFLIPKGTRSEMFRQPASVPADTTSVATEMPATPSVEKAKDASSVLPFFGAASQNRPTEISHVICGSFRNRKNAEAFAQQLASTGAGAQVLDVDHKGYHLVSIGTASTADDAARILKQFQSGRFPDAWLLTGNE